MLLKDTTRTSGGSSPRPLYQVCPVVINCACSFNMSNAGYVLDIACMSCIVADFYERCMNI